jgi:SWI/SNF-related matrix-associated actin-dependent regulator 1 of chromatin subfamily A
MQLRPYQLYGALWLAQSERAMLGDPPGLGKTPQAIKACELVEATHVVVICPAVAVSNWRREWNEWWTRPSWTVELEVYSYDKIVRDKGLRQRLATMSFDVLILDEAHYLKTIDSGRTKCIYNPKKAGAGISSSATYCWALSGTFAPNHVGEYWTHLRTLFPSLLERTSKECLGYIGFLKHFTHWKASEFGVQVLGVRRERRAEFAAVLREAGLRREIADVLPELPPISWGTVTVPAGDAEAELRAAEQDPNVQSLRQHLEETGNFLPDSVHFATLRRLIGRAKARSVAALVREELFQQQYFKVVIWAWHTEVIDALAESLGGFGPFVLDGRTPQHRRGGIVKQFQEQAGYTVLIAQIQAAGTAITLTAANQVVFVESSWVPDENEQAAKRCHRYGQQQPVFVRIAALDQSIDQIVAATINRKLQNKIQIGDN